MVQLQHQTFQGDTTLYFYDGEAVVKNGIISLPIENPDWLPRAYARGFQIDPTTGAHLQPDEARAKFSR
jgi:hypothetical protein